MFGNYIKSMPKLNDAEERKKKSLKPGPAHVSHKYSRGLTSSGKSSSSTRCQKCENFGHYTYNCPVAHAPYKARPSRTQQLLNPKSSRHVPSVQVPDEFLSKKGIAEKILAANELERQEAQSKLVHKKKKKVNASSDTSSSSSSSDSHSTSDSDSDDSSSSSSTTSSSSSSDSSDSSSASDSTSSSSSEGRRVKHRPASPSSSAKSFAAPRRHRHRSRSVSRKPVGSRTPPSPRPGDLPHRPRERVRSPPELVNPRASLSPPRRTTSRSNIGEYSRDQKSYRGKSSDPPRRHHRSPTPPSPRRKYSASHRARSPWYPVGSGASPHGRLGSRLGSRSPRRRVNRPNSGYDSRGSSRDRSRKINASPVRAYRDRSRSVMSRESAGSRTPPSPRRRYSPHRSERHGRLPPVELRASLSPRRDSKYHTGSSRRKVIRDEEVGYPSRASSTERHRKKIDRTVSPDSPRRHRHRERSISRESGRSRTPPSPEPRHSPHRSHKRARSPRHSVDSRAPQSPRHGRRPYSRSPRRQSSRQTYEFDSRPSVRPRR